MLFKNYGEGLEIYPHMPEKRVLPRYSTKRDIFNIFETTMKKNRPDKKWNASTFYKIWKADFGYIINRSKSHMGKCEMCRYLKIQRTLARISGDVKVIQRANDLLYDHHVTVQDERGAYVDNICKAIHQPHEFMSITIDGINELTTEIPVLETPGTEDNIRKKFSCPTTGGLIHGIPGVGPQIFINDGRIPKDANVTIISSSDCWKKQSQRTS